MQRYRIAPTSPEGDESYHAFAMQELLKLAEQTPAGPTVIDAEFVERQLAATAESTPPKDGARRDSERPLNEDRNDDQTEL